MLVLFIHFSCHANTTILVLALAQFKCKMVVYTSLTLKKVKNNLFSPWQLMCAMAAVLCFKMQVAS